MLNYFNVLVLYCGVLFFKVYSAYQKVFSHAGVKVYNIKIYCFIYNIIEPFDNFKQVFPLDQS